MNQSRTKQFRKGLRKLGFKHTSRMRKAIKNIIAHERMQGMTSHKVVKVDPNNIPTHLIQHV